MTRHIWQDLASNEPFQETDNYHLDSTLQDRASSAYRSTFTVILPLDVALKLYACNIFSTITYLNGSQYSNRGKVYKLLTKLSLCICTDLSYIVTHYFGIIGLGRMGSITCDHSNAATTTQEWTLSGVYRHSGPTVWFNALDIDHHGIITCQAFDEQGQVITQDQVTLIINGKQNSVDVLLDSSLSIIVINNISAICSLLMLNLVITIYQHPYIHHHSSRHSHQPPKQWKYDCNT